MVQTYNAISFKMYVVLYERPRRLLTFYNIIKKVLQFGGWARG